MTTIDHVPQTQTSYDGGIGGGKIGTGFEDPDDHDPLDLEYEHLLLLADDEARRGEIAALEKAFAASGSETIEEGETSQQAELGSTAVSGASVTPAEEFLKRLREKIGAENPDGPGDLVA